VRLAKERVSGGGGGGGGGGSGQARSKPSKVDAGDLEAVAVGEADESI
jgi:hypothetical protein